MGCRMAACCDALTPEAKGKAALGPPFFHSTCRWAGDTAGSGLLSWPLGDTGSMVIDFLRGLNRGALVGLSLRMGLFGGLLLAFQPVVAQGERAVYRCPGNLYTDQISAKEAQERGCKTLSGAPVTVVQGQRPKAAPASGPSAGVPVARGNEARIDPNEQKARDTDARRILESELRKEEERLAQLQKDLAQGEAERRGDERNYARYLERINELKAAVARKEADVAALRRELAKLGAP